jgi:type II secretory pathway component GspD/PulD (secretin)
MEFGIDLNFLSGQGFISDIRGATGGTLIETVGFTGTQSGNGLAVGVTSGDVVALITALQSITDTTILANPKILAVNKQEGSMLIGKNLGYRSSTTVGSGGVATQGEVEFLKTGTQLVFRPYIGNDGYIRMEIYPKDSTATLDNDGVPTEKTTELKSNIMVKDGETIVIGGLFRDVVTSSRSQVPILGDIPLLGYLFRGSSDSSERQEVIVLLTPHNIDSPSQTHGDERLADTKRKYMGAVKELPFFHRARVADEFYNRAAENYTKGCLANALSDLNTVLYFHPTHLEALRLKENIIAQTSTNDGKAIQRIVLEQLESQESPMWLRR